MIFRTWVRCLRTPRGRAPCRVAYSHCIDDGTLLGDRRSIWLGRDRGHPAGLRHYLVKHIEQTKEQLALTQLGDREVWKAMSRLAMRSRSRLDDQVASSNPSAATTTRRDPVAVPCSAASQARSSSRAPHPQQLKQLAAM